MEILETTANLSVATFYFPVFVLVGGGRPFPILKSIKQAHECGFPSFSGFCGDVGMPQMLVPHHLMVALLGHVGIVERMLRRRADVGKAHNKFHKPLTLAARWDNSDAVPR